MTLPVGFLLAGSVVMLWLAGVLVAVETALGSLTRAAIEDLIEEGRKKARRLDQVFEHRRRAMLAARAVRIGVQMVVAAAVTLVIAATGWYWWVVLLGSIFLNWILTYLLVSLLPQAIGYRRPASVALSATGLLELLLRASHLLDPVFTLVKNRIPPAAQTDAQVRAAMTEQMREVVDEVGDTDGFEAEDRQMMRNVFQLGHTYVREVMVPRTDMITINADTSVDKALGLFVRSGFSRIPVIGDDIDDVVGILYFKDVVSKMRSRRVDATRPVRDLCRPPHFVVEMKRADDELRLMQKERVHMVLVVDEYGGIAGLLTIEDLIEEIVGEVRDEHDRFEVEPQQLEPGVWRISTRLGLDELGELLGMELEDEDVDSVGGLLAKTLGKVPLPGAHATALGVEMVADEAVGRRRQVRTVVARKMEDETSELSQ
ncbi:hemolysin family protein [Gleimia hominis]|uniref:Hemolysin family protein n=1 Tax=Gleimia hominis TaxID=595468 RepID=A0ABU3IC24_9ACTO|nr:hemolysin family protein [Gleimia hominis]MDT3767481.1 hemolysin family protein [Gleimia hominis]